MRSVSSTSIDCVEEILLIDEARKDHADARFCKQTPVTVLWDQMNSFLGHMICESTEFSVFGAADQDAGHCVDAVGEVVTKGEACAH